MSLDAPPPPRAEWRALVALSLPVILTQIAQMSLGIIDIAMLANYSTQATASAALGEALMMALSIVAMGVVLGMDPIVSQAHGSGDRERIAIAVQRGVVLALGLSLILIAITFFVEPILRATGQDAELAHGAQVFVWALIPSIPSFLVFAALRQYLQGRGITGPMLWISIAANGVNLLGNWLLIYGHWGLPELGVAGSGLSTSLTRVLSLLVLVVWIRASGLHRDHWRPWSRAALAWRGLREILEHGVPTGLQLGLEVWAFSVAGLMAGKISGTALASHQIVLKLASFSFMMPLGVSIASATRVGNLIGSGDRRAAQHAAWVGLRLGAGVMAAWALAFTLGRHALPALFSPDPEVLALCASILPIAAAFQIFDGVQAVGSGILRGMGRTRPAVIFNLIAYFVIGLPIAWWLAFHTDMRLAGIWTGLAIGLLVAAVLYVLFVWRAGPARA